MKKYYCITVLALIVVTLPQIRNLLGFVGFCL